MTRAASATIALCSALALSVVPTASAAVWRPRPGTSWQWQLQGKIDTTVRARVYNVDGFDTPRRVVRKLHERGRRVICYVSAGSWERWRPDASDFPKRVLGKPLEGWAGERWLDVRERAALRPIMRKRVRMCARKRFDAVEFDNVDGYANASGFPLDGVDQRRFNKMLAGMAHDADLSAGLKNDLAQIERLEPFFDFAVNEECFNYRECYRLKPFVKAGKAVLHVEYELPRSRFCARTTKLGFSSMRKRWSLRAWRKPC